MVRNTDYKVYGVIMPGVPCMAIDMQNESILLKRIAELLPLGGSSFLLILITSLIGALLAGIGVLTASYLRNRKIKSGYEK